MEKLNYLTDNIFIDKNEGRSYNIFNIVNGVMNQSLMTSFSNVSDEMPDGRKKYLMSNG